MIQTARNKNEKECVRLTQLNKSCWIQMKIAASYSLASSTLAMKVQETSILSS